jgi:hypothetical protein
LSFYAYGGIPTTISFVILPTLWLATAFLAYKAVREKRILDHKEWMLRNYALTMSAFTLRIMLIFDVVAQRGGAPSEVGYTIIAWLCWIVNAIIMELWIWFVEKRDQKNAAQLPTTTPKPDLDSSPASTDTSSRSE